MSDDDVREWWRDWARRQGIPAERLEAAIAAALLVGGAGARPEAAAAAARHAGGRATGSDLDLLRAELARTELVRDDLGRLVPRGALTVDALAELTGAYATRGQVLAAALEKASLESRPASAPPAPPPSPPPAAASSGRAPGPSLAEFLGDHSILLLSYTGAFLLIVAAVLYELYAVAGLSGGPRLAGVLGLDVVFGAAGWAGLRSRRLRLVGHTYVAIFALLAPLVAVAAYVFLGLGARGISPQVARLLAGSALAVLYGALAGRLRSPAYALFALAALPVAWLSGLELALPAAWQGPGLGPLVAVYALVAVGSRRLPWLGDGFRRWVAAYLHGAAILVLALVAAALLGSGPAWLPWVSGAALAEVGAGYLLFRLLGAGQLAAMAALAAITAAWAVSAHDLGLGSWSAVAVTPLVAVWAVIGYRPGRLAAALAAPARWFVHVTAALAAVIAVATWVGDVGRPGTTTWPLAAASAALAATYVLHRVLSGRPLALLVAATATSLAVLAAVAALGLDLTAGAVALVLLAAGWGLAAEAARAPSLRWGLRAGLVAQALLPALFVGLPAGRAALVLLASSALLAAATWRGRSPSWLVPTAVAITVGWYWWSRALPLPAPTPPVAVAYAPFPAVVGAGALALRALAGRRWGLPAYLLAGLAAPAALLLAAPAGDPGLAGRELLAGAAVAYAIAAVERSTPAVAGAVGAAALGLVLVLAGAGAGHLWFPVAVAALGVTVYAAHLAWERARPLTSWAASHRFLGLGATAVAAASAFALPADTGPGSRGALLAAGGMLLLAGLLAFDGRRRGLPLSGYAAVVVASLATWFLARYLDTGNPQWFVAAPGTALVACGLRLPRDRRLALDRWALQAPTALGAALLLGTTAGQAFADAGWAYTAALVLEGVAALLAGIATRSRVLVLAGAAAVAAGGLRALFVLVQQGLLFAAFGAVAVLLLGLGAALALLRERFQRAGGRVAAWRDWD